LENEVVEGELTGVLKGLEAMGSFLDSEKALENLKAC
jgi:hypothetical protein